MSESVHKTPPDENPEIQLPGSITAHGWLKNVVARPEVKTVSVPVLDDAHDEGEETFTFTLSNVRGNAWLADATATGTIENSDAMPRAWLGRFERTVAEQVIEAVEGRFSAGRSAGVEVHLAGHALEGAAEHERDALEAREAERRLEAMSRWLAGGREDEDARPGASGALTARDVVLGSSFALTGGTPEDGYASLWAHGAVSRFAGREGELSLSGEVTSAMLGADVSRESAVAGLMLTHSRGEGSYRGAGEGRVSSTLTGLYPYGRRALGERVTLWGIAGYGAGELVLTPEGQPGMRTDMDLVMGAVGLRGVAVEAPAEGGFELAVKTDATAVRTTSEKTRGLEAAEADVTRLRLGLEGAWRGLALGTGTLEPALEARVRHDGGDAETGFGLDLGGGLAWSDPQSGLTAELRGRGLLTHESQGFRDRGLSGVFAWAPGRGSGRGPSLTLTQSVGAQTSGGVDALVGQRHLGGLAADGDGADSGNELESRRFELRMGYGLSVLEDRFTLTPEAGLGVSNGHRQYTLGWRLAEARRFGLVFGLDVEGVRRESAAGGAEHRMGVGLGWRLARGAAVAGAAFEVKLEATRSEAAGANDNQGPQHGVGLRAMARW